MKRFLSGCGVFLLVIGLAVVLFVVLKSCIPGPPLPPQTTATLRPSPTLTRTAILTSTSIQTQSAPSVTPMPTFTPMPIPTLTPRPTQILMELKVKTGYDPGYLFYRERATKTRVLAVLHEGDKLFFIKCANPRHTQFAWVNVMYMGLRGWVYGKFVEPYPC